MLHSAPCDRDEKDGFHWHLEIMPRLTIAAGFEMGSGIYINVTPPELAASCLRDVEIPQEQWEAMEPAPA